MKTATYPTVGWGKECFLPLQLSETACEFVWTMQPGGSVPEHLHKDCDEHFEVLEGEITSTIAGKTVVAKAGETFTVPRMTLHSPANKGKGDLRCRVWFTPAAEQAKFFQILLFLKGEKMEGMSALLKAMYISDQLGYREFSTMQGSMKVIMGLMVGYFKLVAPLFGWNKLVRQYVQKEMNPKLQAV